MSIRLSLLVLTFGLLAALPAAADDIEQLHQRLRDLAKMQAQLPKPNPSAEQMWQILDTRLAELQVMAQSHEQEMRRCIPPKPACEARLASQRLRMQHTAEQQRAAYQAYFAASQTDGALAAKMFEEIQTVARVAIAGVTPAKPAQPNDAKKSGTN